jgi:hypothetical protein
MQGDGGSSFRKHIYQKPTVKQEGVMLFVENITYPKLSPEDESLERELLLRSIF